MGRGCSSFVLDSEAFLKPKNYEPGYYKFMERCVEHIFVICQSRSGNMGASQLGFHSINFVRYIFWAAV